MMLETETMTYPDIQTKLWGRMLGESGITKRLTQTGRGYLPRGITVNGLVQLNGVRDVLGEFAPRVLVASTPAEPFFPPDIAIAGGWCAVRTRDLADITNGVITDPIEGSSKSIICAEQLSDWLQQAIAFDQVVESIGPLQGAEYAAISERKLWSERITSKLAQALRRKLTNKESGVVEMAVETAEQKRALITERYLQYVTGNDQLKLQRVVDDDIWTELKIARAEMLGKGGVSLYQLQRWFPNEAKFIPSTALVWAMYSQPYFDALRSRGYITKPNVLIAEPILHACSENMADLEIARSIYQENGVYFDPRGFNGNTGFVAFFECMDGNGQNIRKTQSIGEVPNIVNWREMLRSSLLDPELNASLNLTENRVFLWGLNLFPFRTTRESLLKIVDLANQFKKEKAKISAEILSSANGRGSKETGLAIKMKVDTLKQEFTRQVGEQNSVIVSDLTKLLSYITEGE